MEGDVESGVLKQSPQPAGESGLSDVNDGRSGVGAGGGARDDGVANEEREEGKGHEEVETAGGAAADAEAGGGGGGGDRADHKMIKQPIDSTPEPTAAAASSSEEKEEKEDEVSEAVIGEGDADSTTDREDSGEGAGAGVGAGDDEGRGGQSTKRRHKHHLRGASSGAVDAGVGAEDGHHLPAHPLSSGELARGSVGGGGSGGPKLNVDPQELLPDVDVTPGGGGGAGTTEDEKLVEFPPLPGCNRIFSRYFVTEPGSVAASEELPSKNLSHVFSFGHGYHYAHMAVVAAISPPWEPRSAASADRSGGSRRDPVLMAAWQAAPGVPPDENGKQRFAVEGLEDQRILYAVSKDGGETWSEPKAVPVRHPSDDNYRAGDRPAWGPVLHYDRRTDRVFVFYSLSRECARPTSPKTWEPGGDVRVVVGEHLAGVDAREPKWGRPTTLLRESEDGVPKVVAARMLALRDGTWLLPYWSEQPRGDRVAMYVDGGSGLDPGGGGKAGDHRATTRFAAVAGADAGGLGSDTVEGNGNGGGSEKEEEEPFDVNACHAPVTPKGQAAELFGNRTYAGVLLSTDRGASWQAHGRLVDPRTDLIEGVALELSDRVLMLFRTKVGCVFASSSVDGGRTWSPAAPLNVPNSNTKLDAIVLSPYPDFVLMALNNHRRGPFCEGCRTHLDLIASPDGGATWRHVASIEDEIRPGVRIHYPTMLQLDDARVVVSYSRFYLGGEGGAFGVGWD